MEQRIARVAPTHFGVGRFNEFYLYKPIKAKKYARAIYWILYFLNRNNNSSPFRRIELLTREIYASYIAASLALTELLTASLVIWKLLEHPLDLAFPQYYFAGWPPL